MTEMPDSINIESLWRAGQPLFQLGYAQGVDEYVRNTLRPLMNEIMTRPDRGPVSQDDDFQELGFVNPLLDNLFAKGIRTVSDLTRLTYWQAERELELKYHQVLYVELVLFRSGHRFALVVDSRMEGGSLGIDIVPDDLGYNITSEEKARYIEKSYGDERIPDPDLKRYENRFPGPTGWRSSFGQDPGGQPL